MRSTDRQDDVHGLHQAEDDMSNFGEMMPVARQDQEARNDVVREHLVVVFAALLDVDHNDLLQPERKLDEVVAFHDALQLPVGPGRPHLAEVEPVVGMVEYVLRCWSAGRMRTRGIHPRPLTIPNENMEASYKNSQACSANRTRAFLFLTPAQRAKGMRT